jgi:hypothetical protein
LVEKEENMKWFANAVFFLLLGFAIGWYGGKRAANRAPRFDPSQPYQSGGVAIEKQDGAVAVDCYDAKGNLVPDFAKQFGGVTVACGPGETTKIHQDAPKP